MTKHLSRRIFLLSLLYACIIFGILAVQFTNGNAFSISLDSMMVTGTMETDETGTQRPLLPLHIAVNGLDFFVDEKNSLRAWADDGSPVPLKLAGIDRGSASVTVRFVGDVAVTFSPEKRGDSDVLTITASLPSKYQKIAFPYKTTRSARVEKKDNLTLVSVGKKQFYFSGSEAQPSTPLDSSSVRRLALSAADPVVSYQTWIPAKGLAVDELGGIPGASQAAYQKAVEKFAAASLASFKTSVQDERFSEPLVAAYIAEMARIGMYQAAIESIPESYRNGSSRTYLTNVYLNNLERTWNGLVAKEREDRSALSRKLTENNPAVFEFPSLVPYLVDRGSAILLGDLVRVASGLNTESVSAVQAAGILEASLDYPKYAPDGQSSFPALGESCERRIKATLVKIDDKLYVSDDGNTIDTRGSLRVASVLIRYGSSAPERASWTSVGRLIVTSLVAFAGDQAVLPAQFTLAGDGNEKTGIIAQGDQMLSPATLYPLVVTDNTWYPHALSLASQAGPGVWAWTCARSVQIAKPSADSMRITASFPQGDTHYMVIRGIKPFGRIQIYGMDFHTDPRFESYNSSGYKYDPETGTLFLKMRHKAENEDVVIWFSPAGSAQDKAASSDDAQPAGDGSGTDSSSAGNGY